MSKLLGHYVSVAFLPWFVLSGAAACGTGGDEPPVLPVAAPPAQAAEGDAAMPLRPLINRKQVAPAAEEPADAGLGRIDMDAADGGAVEAGPEATAPRCVPEAGTDEPDESFADTNCDGIDGDASKAFFVAPTGSDSASGEMTAPFKTITRAVIAAAHDGKDVYVCNGDYPEAVRIDRLSVSIYGGYDCSKGWKRVADRATVDPISGVPLTITGTVDAVVIDRLKLKAPDAKELGASSIAASLVGSQTVTFRRSELIAQNGAPGKEGAPPDPWTAPQAPAAAGRSVAQQDCTMDNGGHILQGGAGCSVVPSGGSGDQRICYKTWVVGGAGGNGGNISVPIEAEPGWDGYPSFDPFESGRAGRAGAVGKPGAPALLGFGRIDLGRYVPDNRGYPANPGDSGEAGYGGGGGISVGRGDVAKAFWIGGGGGQGGYAGCGGAGGNPGDGGGASIALLSDSSGVRLEYSWLLTGMGGDGGPGSEGAAGQKGGSGGPGGTGSGDSTFSGYAGGKGGDGGKGGAGGPGGGGPSVAVAWTGTAPVSVATTFTLGEAGRGGTTSARTAADGVVAEFYPPVKAGDAGLGGAQ